MQVIYGTAGVGKTQLALEYAYRHREHYSTIGWLPASRAERAGDSLPTLGITIQPLDPGGPRKGDAANRAAGTCARSDWLLIFDDAPGPEAIAPYLPGGNGHVLVTSRNTGWQAFGMPFLFACWNAARSREFLRRGNVTETPAATLA